MKPAPPQASPDPLAALPPGTEITTPAEARARGITQPVTARFHQDVAGYLMPPLLAFVRDGIPAAIVAVKGSVAMGTAYLELWRPKAKPIQKAPPS